MQGKHTQKRVNATTIVTTVYEIFKPVLKNLASKNLILSVIGIASVKTNISH